MKPNHHPIETIRVCELQLGDTVMLSGRVYKVTAITEERVTCRLIDHPPIAQYFKAKSQQKVELVNNVKSENNGKQEKGIPKDARISLNS